MTKTLPDLHIFEDCTTLELMEKAAALLDLAGQNSSAKEMCYRIAVCDKNDPYIAKSIIDEYVNVIDETTEEEDYEPIL